MRPRFLDLLVHLARLGASAAAIALAAHLASTLGMLAGAALLFLEAFALMHDLSHGALRLPRRANEIALALAGLVLLMSAHAVRRTHLVHHARPLADDDIEGRAARESFFTALASSPRAAIAQRVRAFRGAGPRAQRWQIAETAAGLVLATALLASRSAPLVLYALVSLTAQATMSMWAAHIPHNAPAWLLRIASRLAWTGSPTMLNLAYHELHHAHPAVPCRNLGRVSRELTVTISMAE